MTVARGGGSGNGGHDRVLAGSGELAAARPPNGLPREHQHTEMNLEHRRRKAVRAPRSTATRELNLATPMAAAVEAQARRALPEVKRSYGVVRDVEELTVRLCLRGIGWWCLTVVEFSVAAADAPPVAARSVAKETRRQKKEQRGRASGRRGVFGQPR
jgi:hypothetical protein